MGSLSVMSLVAMVLPHAVLAECGGVKAEDKNDPVRDALIQLATFILHPDNQHFAEMRNYFTLSRLSTFGTLLLGSVLNSIFKSLVEPCMPEKEKPEKVVEKEWKFLSVHEVEKIKTEPYKYLRLRYRINKTASVLFPIIRLVFIHMIPATIVLRWGHDEMATDVWQLSVKAFFMTLYAIYLARVVFIFSHRLENDEVGLAHYFLVPFPFVHSRDYADTDLIKDIWDSREENTGPVPWFGGLLLWCTFGLEIVLAELVSNKRLWMLILVTKWSLTLGCLFFCLTEASPQFWNLAGAFLGSMSFFGFVLTAAFLESRKGRLMLLWLR